MRSSHLLFDQVEQRDGLFVGIGDGLLPCVLGDVVRPPLWDDLPVIIIIALALFFSFPPIWRLDPFYAQQQAVSSAACSVVPDLIIVEGRRGMIVD